MNHTGILAHLYFAIGLVPDNRGAKFQITCCGKFSGYFVYAELYPGCSEVDNYMLFRRVLALKIQKITFQNISGLVLFVNGHRRLRRE